MRAAVAAVAAAVLVAGCGSSTAPVVVPGGDAARGKQLIQHYGCGGCHMVPGVAGARGRVGPPLEQFRQVRFIAGRIPNSPQNAIRWIHDPQAIEPGTIMPKLGVTTPEARDIVAYLYGH